MPPRARAVAAAAGLVLAAARPALAWDAQGHMASGAIAYDVLARSHPEVVHAVVALMDAHPDRARFERELGDATGALRDRLLFEYMARWSDDVRGTRFDRPDWHYSLRIVSPVGGLLAFHNGRAEEVYPAQLKIALDPRAATAERATALCWVFHILGDMHQPLHAGHWMSLRFPATDRAGTIAWVRPAPDARPMRLHVFWDRACDRPGGQVAGATALAVEAEAQAASVTPSPADARAAVGSWAASSRRLALEVAYEGGRFEGGASPESAPVLTAAYLDRAHATAVRRIAEAGVRLAQVLTTLPVPPNLGG